MACAPTNAILVPMLEGVYGSFVAGKLSEVSILVVGLLDILTAIPMLF
jgi:hypothetical protein